MKELVTAYSRQGGCISSFCLAHGIKPHVFRYWHKRYGIELADESSSIGGFKEIIAPSGLNSGGCVFARVRVGSDVDLEFFEPVDATYLRSLLGW
jgi:hypothetical protein